MQWKTCLKILPSILGFGNKKTSITQALASFCSPAGSCWHAKTAVKALWVSNVKCSRSTSWQVFFLPDALFSWVGIPAMRSRSLGNTGVKAKLKTCPGRATFPTSGREGRGRRGRHSPSCLCGRWLTSLQHSGKTGSTSKLFILFYFILI